MCARAQEINEFPLEANSPLECVLRKVQVVQIPGSAVFQNNILDLQKICVVCRKFFLTSGGFEITRLWPAFGRQSLVGSSGTLLMGTLLTPRLAPAALGSVKL